ncbi:MAG: LysR substrate-binding domain-containing protein [Gemmatimonadaceae bacterium]
MPPSFTLGSTVTLTQLLYAAAVDTHRHFGRAADACNVSQPTLSIQLHKLEKALGVTLFDRSRSPVVPTDTGRILVEQARLVLRETMRLTDLCDTAAGLVTGELRLGVIPTLAPYLLPRVVEILAQRHPDLELVVEERVTESILDGLRSDTLDAALVASRIGVPDIIENTLFREPFFGYVGSSHRLAKRGQLTVSDLSLNDLWLLSDGHCMRTQVVSLCQQRTRKHQPGMREAGAGIGTGCARAVRFESGNLETLKRLVERGVGMTLLPALAAADLSSNAQRRLLATFANPVPSRDVRLIRRRAHLRQHLVSAVVAIVREVATAAIATMPQPPRQPPGARAKV